MQYIDKTLYKVRYTELFSYRFMVQKYSWLSVKQIHDENLFRKLMKKAHYGFPYLFIHSDITMIPVSYTHLFYLDDVRQKEDVNPEDFTDWRE